MWLRPAPEQSPEVQRLLARRRHAPRALWLPASCSTSSSSAAHSRSPRSPSRSCRRGSEERRRRRRACSSSSVSCSPRGSCSRSAPATRCRSSSPSSRRCSCVPPGARAAVGRRGAGRRALDRRCPGERRPSRLLNALADSWFSIGPAVVLVLAGSPAADAGRRGVLVAALAAQFVVDAVASRAREWLHGGRLAARAARPERLDLLRRRPALAARVRRSRSRRPRARGGRPRLAACSCCSRLFARERDERLALAARAQRGLPRHRTGARRGGRARRRLHRRLHIRGVAELAVEIAADLRPRRLTSGAWSSSGRSCTTSARSRSRTRSSRSPARSTSTEWRGDQDPHDRGPADAGADRRPDARRRRDRALLA